MDMLAVGEVLGRFTATEREALAGSANRRRLGRGINLCYQGEPWPYVFLIASGELKSVIRSTDGRPFVVSTWGRGVEFWGHTVFDGEGMPSTVEAVMDTIGYQWQGERVVRMAFRNNDVMRALLKRQTQLIRKRRQAIYDLAFNPVASRLAKLVIEKFENVEGPTIQRDLTLEEMASLVGTSPEVICRVLYHFQAEGWLKVNRASMTLHDRQAMEKLIMKD